MFLSQIVVYPIKSMDGMVVRESRLTAGGILEFDRIFALVNEAGGYVNGKKTPRVQLLRSTFDPACQEVCVWETDSSVRVHFSLREPEAFNRWLSDFFGFAVRMICESTSGFPDDRTAFGPTITSEASLHAITEWFPEMSLESARRRFRSNLELSGGPPFWEDHLFGEAGQLKPFAIGDVNFLGHNPCQRCVVPTRDPDRTEPIANFQKEFMAMRKKHLPAWSNADRFNHYYRFAINTSVLPSEAGKILRVGDVVQTESPP